MYLRSSAVTVIFEHYLYHLFGTLIDLLIGARRFGKGVTMRNQRLQCQLGEPAENGLEAAGEGPPGGQGGIEPRHL